MLSMYLFFSCIFFLCVQVCPVDSLSHTDLKINIVIKYPCIILFFSGHVTIYIYIYVRFKNMHTSVLNLS